MLEIAVCDDDIADTLVTIIDRIIIDEYIKPSPVENSLPLSQKEELIYNKRNDTEYHNGKSR